MCGLDYVMLYRETCLPKLHIYKSALQVLRLFLPLIVHLLLLLEVDKVIMCIARLLFKFLWAWFLALQVQILFE